MSERTETRPTLGDILDEGAALLAGVGMITIVLFPFALPALILAAVALVPLVVLALVAAVIAAPVLAVRGVMRRRSAHREDVADRSVAAATGSLTAPPSVRVARP